MQRVVMPGVVLVAAMVLAGCGSISGSVAGSSSARTTQDPNLATASATPLSGSVASEACSLVSADLVRQTLELDVGTGAKALKTTDLSVCDYKPSPTSFVLVQSTHSADAFFPSSMYPVKGMRTVTIPGADRGYASVVDGSGLMNISQVLVVKGGRGVQVSVAMKGDYTTDDLVALGRKVLAEL